MTFPKITIESNNINFSGVLTIVFIALKLTGCINWSWWWVLCPLWIGFAIFFSMIIAVCLTALFVVILEQIYKK